ncbi:MAG: 4a-hydroxytetrahydrobiopterin dehydratase [Anaerolineales bacterium]|jgi:4a-hydroxytetrahydrobiopterin dehydratase
MVELGSKEIRSYHKGEKPLTGQAVENLLAFLPGWQVVEREGIPRLEKSYKFADFRGALDFANLVGEKAEQADHHPAILISWGRTAVSWWTHAVNGLHENDFIMAARTDQLYQKVKQADEEG